MRKVAQMAGGAFLLLASISIAGAASQSVPNSCVSNACGSQPRIQLAASEAQCRKINAQCRAKCRQGDGACYTRCGEAMEHCMGY